MPSVRLVSTHGKFSLTQPNAPLSMSFPYSRFGATGGGTLRRSKCAFKVTNRQSTRFCKPLCVVLSQANSVAHRYEITAYFFPVLQVSHL